MPDLLIAALGLLLIYIVCQWSVRPVRGAYPMWRVYVGLGLVSLITAGGWFLIAIT